jgi:hypothetical protein
VAVDTAPELTDLRGVRPTFATLAHAGAGNYVKLCETRLVTDIATRLAEYYSQLDAASLVLQSRFVI